MFTQTQPSKIQDEMCIAPFGFGADDKPCLVWHEPSSGGLGDWWIVTDEEGEAITASSVKALRTKASKKGFVLSTRLYVK